MNFIAYAVALAVGLLVIACKVSSSQDIIKKKPNRTMMGYKLIYTDQKEVDPIEGVTYSTLLKSERHRIQGKPDYLYQKNIGGSVMPIELKSGKIGDRTSPYDGDLMQLVAYFLIVEEEYSIRPREGRLVYRDYMFKVKNSRRLRKRLLATLADMRTMLQTGEQTVDPNYTRCKYCVCRGTVCPYAK